MGGICTALLPSPRLPPPLQIWRDKSAFTRFPPALGSYGETSRRDKPARQAGGAGLARLGWFSPVEILPSPG
jgi:hypothetical protein